MDIKKDERGNRMNSAQVINLFIEWSKIPEIKGKGFDVIISDDFKEFRIKSKGNEATE